MKAANRLSLQLSVACAIVLAASSAWLMMATGKAASAQVQSKTPKDPCWFMSLKDESIPFDVIEERQKREMYGYPADISLGEAIRISMSKNNVRPYTKDTRP